MNAAELQIHFSFKAMSMKQVAFWNSKGVTFVESDGVIVPVISQE